MGFLNRLTIKSRLIFAYLILLFSFIVFAIFSISEIKTVGGLTRSLYEHPLQVSNAALKASMGVIKMHRSMKDVVLSQTERQLNDAIETLRNNMIKVLPDVFHSYFAHHYGNTKCMGTSNDAQINTLLREKIIQESGDLADKYIKIALGDEDYSRIAKELLKEK